MKNLQGPKVAQRTNNDIFGIRSLDRQIKKDWAIMSSGQKMLVLVALVPVISIVSILTAWIVG